MRGAMIAAAACLVLLLGAVQVAAMALYGDLANPPAIPALLPPALGMALAQPLQSRLAPALLRAAYAQALLHRGDRTAASIASMSR
jgi:hypothetical protein